MGHCIDIRPFINHSWITKADKDKQNRVSCITLCIVYKINLEFDSLYTIRGHFKPRYIGTRICTLNESLFTFNTAKVAFAAMYLAVFIFIFPFLLAHRQVKWEITSVHMVIGYMDTLEYASQAFPVSLVTYVISCCPDRHHGAWATLQYLIWPTSYGEISSQSLKAGRLVDSNIAWLWNLRGTLVAWTAPSHYLNQCWNIVNWTLRNKLNI